MLILLHDINNHFPYYHTTIDCKLVNSKLPAEIVDLTIDFYRFSYNADQMWLKKKGICKVVIPRVP